MLKPKIPENEEERINALVDFDILDTLPEQSFEDLTKIAAEICGTPIALVSLVDQKRQWFKSHLGLGATETARDLAFCAHAINEPDDILVVPDASKDERFFDNPLSVDDPHVIFYAGAPLVTSDGLAMGTLCVIDHVPRELTDAQLEALRALSRQVIKQMEYRKSQFSLEKINRELRDLSIVASGTDNAVIMASQRGHIEWVNDAFTRLSGYTLEEARGQHPAELLSGPLTSPETVKEMSIQFKNKKSFKGEIINYHKDGNQYWISMEVTPILNDLGNVEKFVVFERDISDRKKTEEQLKQYEKFFLMSIDPLCIARTDGYFQKLNPAFEIVLGFTEKEMMAKPFVEFIHPDDVEATLAEVEKLARGIPTIGFVNRYKCKDGSFRVFDWTCTPDPVTGELYALAHDITDVRKVQDDLGRLSLDYQGQLKAINRSAARVEFDMEGAIIDANDNFLNLMGYSKEDLYLAHHTLFLPKDTKDSKEYLDFWKQLRAGQFISGEFERETKTGETVWIHGSYNPVMDPSGVPYKVIKIAYDITTQKEAEAKIKEYADNLQAINNELDQFAYIVSHDLKAPLRGISTLATFISEDYADKLDEDGKEQIKLMLNRVDRMNNLISGILQYSRIGRLKQEKEEVDLKIMINYVKDMIVPEEGFELKVRDSLPTLKIERVLIEQVFQNLISNAVKYNDKPKGLITITCEDKDDFWQFGVKDNGPGIEEKYFEKIFQIFQTLKARDDYESTGIGLSLIKKTIDQWGGKVWLESEMGKGTAFLFTVPKFE